MRIVFIGDIMGRSGREALQTYLPQVKEKLSPDVVIVNGENAAHGRGITEKFCKEFYEWGVDCITTGNHVWDQREILAYIKKDPRLIRPHNFPKNTTPGNGVCALNLTSGQKIVVVNLMARLFMQAMDCPFQTMEDVLVEHKLGQNCDAIFVDFHGETTSEKMAFGHHFSGRISAMIGTHTHVPTADAHVMAASVPLIVLALAVPILKERVGHRRWFAVVLGFLGVLIILRPGFGNWQPILFLPLLGAFGFAVYLVLTRMAAKFDTIGTSAFYTGVVGLSVLTIFLPLEWKTPTIEEWGWLLLASVLGLCGHISVIKALSIAEASVLQPFFYVVLVWATFLGFIIFDDIPDFITIIGACIIVGSGLYAWYRERVNQNQI